jgi:hypothetical protein
MCSESSINTVRRSNAWQRSGEIKKQEKKMKKRVFITTVLVGILLALLTGCSVAGIAGESTVEGQQSELSEWPIIIKPLPFLNFERELQLHHAEFSLYSGGGFFGRWAKFQVKVDNLQGTKSVALHYRDSDGKWKDLALDKKSSHTNYVLYEYTSNNETRLPMSSFPFCVKYTVDGKTYWDNNGGSNYTINGGTDNLVLPGDVLLDKASVYSWGANWMGQDVSEIKATIFVKNNSYHKDVGIRYCETEEGVWRNLSARYKSTTTSGYEIWEITRSAYTPFRSDNERPQFRFAVYYKNKQNGKEAWDNNFGLDYLMRYNTFDVYNLD